jgi:hypothetical protein
MRDVDGECTSHDARVAGEEESRHERVAGPGMTLACHVGREGDSRANQLRL